MDEFFIKHMSDLSRKSDINNKFTFSNFLNEAEINELLAKKSAFVPFTLFGGCNGASRQMVRFGDENELYYSEDFPIVSLKIQPKNKKFADTLTHRDYLGALMNLSIEREHIGDIIIKDNEAFVFVTSKMSPFICENLTKIKHTDVNCFECEFIQTDKLFELEEITVLSSSLRADCIICAVHNLSRNEAASYFSEKKVYVNSLLCENPSKQLKATDTVSVRGFGKFIFNKELSQTKKGRLKISIFVYR